MDPRGIYPRTCTIWGLKLCQHENEAAKIYLILIVFRSRKNGVLTKFNLKGAVRGCLHEAGLTLVVLAFVHTRPAMTVRLNYGFIMVVNSMESGLLGTFSSV